MNETYVNDTDLHLGYGVARKRMLSRPEGLHSGRHRRAQEPVAVVCTYGKPARRGCWGRSAGISPRSLVVHDRRAHGALIRESGCARGGAQGRRQRPVYLERMAMVNNLCSWLKRYLWSSRACRCRTSVGYPQLVRLPVQGQAGLERWPETAGVVRHLLLTEARFTSST